MSERKEWKEGRKGRNGRGGRGRREGNLTMTMSLGSVGIGVESTCSFKHSPYRSRRHSD
jgi:hypothetical protein